MRMWKGTLTGLCLLAMTMGNPAGAADDPAPAPADSTEAIPSGIPELHGHRFLPTIMVPSPFINTFLRNTLGTGSATDVTTPDFIINGEPVAGLSGNISSANLSFEYQLALKRWLAVRAQFGFTGQFGTGVQTLLAEGLGTSLDVQFGWLISLRQGERSQLSGSLQISNRTVTGISVLNLVRDIVDGTNLGLSHKTPVLNALAGVHWSWAASELVGLTVMGNVGNGETLDRANNSDWFYRTGLAVSFDLDGYGLPMGVAVSGAVDNFGGEGAAERARAVESGIRLSYIGRESFVLSLDMSWSRVPTVGIIQEFDVSSLGLSMRYFF